MLNSQGKFVRIFFSPSGAIAGANINWYLLEKSRVAFRSSGERSFHVFYMLLAACQSKGEGGRRLRGELDFSPFSEPCCRVETHAFSLSFVIAEDLLLDGSAVDYEYLNKSAQVIDGVNDLEEWTLLTVSSLRRVALSLSLLLRSLSSPSLSFLPFLGRSRRRRFLQGPRTTRPLPHRRRHPSSRKHRNLRGSFQPSSNPNSFSSRESLSPPRDPSR